MDKTKKQVLTKINKTKTKKLKIKIIDKKVKYVEFINNNIYRLNNIDNDKLTGNSEFLIGSITKMFTAVLLLILQEKKLVNLNDTLDKYLENTNFKNVKIINIINHISGFKNMYSSHDYSGSKINYKSALEVYEEFKEENLKEHDVGNFIYSNVGYIILGALIEKITNLTYYEALKNYVLKPLSITIHTGITDSNIKLYNNNYKKLTDYEKNERTFAGASGQLKSTVNDLIKFANFYKLLSKTSINILKTLYFYEEKNGKIQIKHTGGINGGGSAIKIKYDTNWNITKIFIELKTCYG